MSENDLRCKKRGSCSGHEHTANAAGLILSEGGNVLTQYCSAFGRLVITKVFRRAGLNDCGLHTLRHTLSSKMVKNGFSLYEVQSILEHTSPTTTTRYSLLESASVSKKVAEKLFAK